MDDEVAIPLSNSIVTIDDEAPRCTASSPVEGLKIFILWRPCSGRLNSDQVTFAPLHAHSRAPWERIGHRLRDYLGGKTHILSTHDPMHSSADVVLTQDLMPAAHGLWGIGHPEAGEFADAVADQIEWLG